MRDNNNSSRFPEAGNYQPKHHAPSDMGSPFAMRHALVGRQSPTGQSSSNQDHVSGSHNSSALSNDSNNNMTTFKPKPISRPPKTLQHGNISPASKYPESDFGISMTMNSKPTHLERKEMIRSSEGRLTPKSQLLQHGQQTSNLSGTSAGIASLPVGSPKTTRESELSSIHLAVVKNKTAQIHRHSKSVDSLRSTTPRRQIPRNPNIDVSYSGSEDEGESDSNYPPIDAMDSIFDYDDELLSDVESCKAQVAVGRAISPSRSPRQQSNTIHVLPGSSGLAKAHLTDPYDMTGSLNSLVDQNAGQQKSPVPRQRSTPNNITSNSPKLAASLSHAQNITCSSHPKTDPAHTRKHLLTNYGEKI